MMTDSDIDVLLTGDELMSGDTVDSNSAMIAQGLMLSGQKIAQKVTLGDERERLMAALSESTRRAGVLIMNGGLGPTQDDLTAELVAAVAGVPLVLHPDAEQHVRRWCGERSIEPNDANLKQAWLPEGAEIIDNPVGSAVGFAIDIAGTLVLTTPGVPSELRAMLPAVCARVAHKLGGGELYRLRLQTFGIGESTAQALIDDDTTPWPDDVVLGFRAGMPQLEIKLTASADTPEVQRCRQTLERLFGDHILGHDDTTLAGAVQTILRAQDKKMVTAESCTGGLIASMMTAEAVVTQMLRGALQRSHADIGIAVSGIAGPGGGTDDKPVGSVWLAWGTADDLHTWHTVLPTDRRMFQQLVAAAGLDLVRRHLLGLPKLPHYFSRRAI
jgi:nicotinamide-nucleotide amidase